MKIAIVHKPYLVCWLTIPGLLLLGYTFRLGVDFQLYDTYFLLSTLEAVRYASFFLLVLGGGYWLLSRNGKVVGTLTVIHLLLTIVPLLAVFPAAFLDSGDGMVWILIAFALGQSLGLVQLLILTFRMLRKL